MSRKIVSLLIGLALILPAGGMASAQQDYLPRVVGAISLSNTQVRVVFNRSMGNRAEDPANYSIVQKNADTNDTRLVITGAQFTVGSQRRMVDLTTSSQSDILYELTVAAVQDWNGSPMAPKEIGAGVVVDPTKAEFQGTPPGENDLIDTDVDGVSNSAEMRGWQVFILFGSGHQITYHVTSDPQNPDTDGEGIADDEELAYGTDPRSSDTDGDMLTDFQELNEIYSDPLERDTDGDGLGDGLEFIHFKTSPIVADTDGDQFTDAQELLELDRNPLIADLPRLQILVGDVRLGLNVISSYTDETGTEKTSTETLQTTLGESRERRFGTSDTVSNETTLTYGQKIGLQVAWTANAFGVTGSVEASFGQTFANGFTATTNRESAERSSREYQDSVSRAFAESQNRSVTRTVNNAEIVAAVNVQNLSDVAFTVTNIEISVLKQDRQTTNRFIPIASLRLEGAADPTQQPAFNLGPFDPERGPFIFRNTNIFPTLVEDLMREPQGLVYRVVNFDLLDEFGRNFVFSSQDVNDRTVGITIDYGEGNVESYRVATHNTYDAEGHMQPITMQRALQIMGITPSDDPSGDTPDADPADPGIWSTYGTQRNVDGVEVLTRIRGVQTDFSSENPEKRFWVIISANREVPDTQDFSTIELRARDNFLLVFTRDLDQDGLLEQEEIFYGSSDQSVDTDGDTIPDFDEVRTGWAVTVKGKGVEKVFSSPASVDTDGDGLNDDIEKQFGTNPTKRDTDFDGLSDVTELAGPIDILLFDGDEDEMNNPLLSVPGYEGPPAIVNAFNATGDTSATGDDVQEVPVGETAADGQVVVSAGPDSEIATAPNTDQDGNLVVHGDDYLRVSHDQEYMTDPLNPDTDYDGISDGREVILGINPNRVDAGSILDSDNDGLTDDEETGGWVANVNGTPTPVTSNPLRADTDRDGIPDVYERAIGSNPRLRDTDGDTLFDYHEFDINDPIHIYSGLVLADAKDRCADASACFYEVPNPDLLIGTDPRAVDTDGDGRSDNVERTEAWNVTLFSGQTTSVTSDPRYADEDGDELNDGEEFASKTDPKNPDSDGDGRLDGDEITAGLNPLRQDYHLTVTLTTVYVNDDCDARTREGLEMQGDFWLRNPDGIETLLYQQGCSTEEGACEVSNCCDAQRCPGWSFEYNKSNTFIFREGQKFTLYTSTLIDNDDYFCPPVSSNTIGSFTRDFDFSLTSLAPTFSQPVGSGGCTVTINYSLKRDD